MKARQQASPPREDSQRKLLFFIYFFLFFFCLWDLVFGLVFLCVFFLCFFFFLGGGVGGRVLWVLPGWLSDKTCYQWEMSNLQTIITLLNITKVNCTSRSPCGFQILM